MIIWHRFLVAVDETETSRRALRYLGQVTGSAQDLEIMLLHIYPEPPPNYLAHGNTLAAYQQEKEEIATRIFSQAVEVLDSFSIPEARIKNMTRMATAGEAISNAIIQVQKEGGFGTVIVGKRGVSKAEEFLFGSISNSLVRNSKDFTVWVVG